MRSSPPAVTRRMISLSALSPGVKIAQESPPASALARRSSRKPDSCLSGPWHL
jgi:hypothetical protein